MGHRNVTSSRYDIDENLVLSKHHSITGKGANIRVTLPRGNAQKETKQFPRNG
jgi:hypothetical protein